MTMNETVLTPPEIAELLRAATAMVRAEWTAMPPPLLSWHPGDGEWCLKETLGHMIEADKHGFAGRIRTLVEQPELSLTGWDQEAVARGRRDCERDPFDLLAEFEALRTESAGFVANLAADQLLRGAEHPDVGYLRAGDVLQEWVHHDREHFRQMLANVQAFVWPSMGNARRFTSP